MKLLLSLCMLLIVSSCENPTGDFTVNESVKLRRKTVLGNTRYVTVPVGNYRAKAKIKNKSISLKIDGFKKKLNFNIPSHVKIPTHSTTIRLTAGEIGQSYDLNADIEVTKFTSTLQRQYENCSYVRYEYGCRRRCDNNGRCHRVCGQYPVTIYGQKRVEFYNRTIERDYELALLTPETEEIMAIFDGKNVVRYRDYTYQSNCR